MGSPRGRVFISRPPAANTRVLGGRPFIPNGRVVPNSPGVPGRVFVGNGFHHSHVIFTTNPFAFGCGGFFPCTSPFFNPFFFSGSFFGAPFFPGSFWPGSFWPGSTWPVSYIPGFSSDYYNPPAPAQQQEPAAAAPADNSNDIALAVQMQRLTDEVEQLRADQMRQRSSLQMPGSSLSAAQPAVATTFVFRDGKRLTATNYAIAGQTLWIFSEHAAKKVALADLDVAATKEINANNGVEIQLPEKQKP